LLGATACGSLADPVSCREPEILGQAVSANPNNVLSAIVTGRTRDADSVGVRFGLTASALDSATPSVKVAGDSSLVPVLGLLPETAYALQLVAHSPCGAAIGPRLELTTGTLPDYLPSFAAGGPAPSTGFVAFATSTYGVVIDNTGRVVWYHVFPNGPGLNFQAQATGRYVARPPPLIPGAPAPWIELDPLGTVTRTLGCARGLQSRFHDMIAEPDGSYWVMCDETRTMDLSAVGGVADASVLGTVIQHVGATGMVLFEWSPFDHLDLTDLDAANRAGTNVNWTHGNALDKDTDGNLLVSFRSLSEIMKIDTRSGAVVWRMGGARNQFTFQGTAIPPFAGQHGLRVDGAGRFVLLDNLGEAAGSRAERYEYDEGLRTARLTSVYVAGGGVVAELGGTTQNLPDGHVLVSYGNGSRVEEYDAEGNVVWRIEGNPGYVFRAQRIGSLYQPGVNLPR
jgi:hypothetical protein